MHTGNQYHEFMLASPQDQAVRDRFQRLALDLLPAGAALLDFGAGTGIDAKAYAAKGHPTFVFEPAEAMRDCLVRNCRVEIAHAAVITVASPLACRVRAVTANFAVFNHFAEHAALFEQLSCVVQHGGFVLASLLNPYCLADARYRWWRSNLVNLARQGHYAIASESGIHRFSPQAMARAAAPHFRLERVVPRGFRLAFERYVLLLFRRI